MNYFVNIWDHISRSSCKCDHIGGVDKVMLGKTKTQGREGGSAEFWATERNNEKWCPRQWQVTRKGPEGGNYWIPVRISTSYRSLIKPFCNNYHWIPVIGYLYHLHVNFAHLMAYELTKWPAPSWLDTCSSVGRALHRYRRGHGFESRSGLNFFQASISQLLKLSV